MKIGLIADIHADLTALRRALALLEREGVDSILCLGDLVDRGQEGDLVVMMIESLDIPCIQGNHDKEAPATQIWHRQQLFEGSEYSRQRLLTKRTLDYLKALPFERRYTWEGMRVLAVHGSPTDQMQYLYAHSPQVIFKGFAKESKADIILCGHTHVPMHIKALGVHFINPGSVWGDVTHGSGTCATLTLPELDFRVFSLATGEIIKP